MGLTGIDELVFDFFWFFWVYAGSVTSSLSKLLFFWVYAGFVRQFGIKMLILIFWVYAGSELFPIKMFVFFEYMQVWGTWGSPNLHILKKINMLMPKVHKTCIYSKIFTKHLIVKSHQTCIYSKKSKKLKTGNSSMPVRRHIESEIFDFFDFFEYMQVWWLFTIETFDFFWVYAGFVHFWHQNVDFFEYVQVWWTSSLSNLHFCNQKTKTQNRYTWYVFLV